MMNLKKEQFPYLRDYTTFLKKMERPLVGRESEMKQIMATLMRPELCNVMLLSDAGVGKTALVRGTMEKDSYHTYLEVDLSKMIADSVTGNERAAMLKQLFAEADAFCKEYGLTLVLFFDEFHQLVQFSAAAVDVLVSQLAVSGEYNVRIIAATTYSEYANYVMKNVSLTEQWVCIELAEPDKADVVTMLKDMAVRRGMPAEVAANDLFSEIYEAANQRDIAGAQPRKSMFMLNEMLLSGNICCVN